MPLIVLVGIPQSGKTRISMEIEEFFKKKGFHTVLINEEALGIDKTRAYSSNFEEKNLRAALKSNVERSLNDESIVIIDSMNYIKGYRYELFCIVRQMKTTLCMVYLEIPKQVAFNRNNLYSFELFEDLANRMEVPNQKNKWDSPLIILRENEEVPLENIFQIIVNGKSLTQNMATVKQPALEQNYLHLVDQAAQAVIEFILKAQEDYNEGGEVPVPLSSVSYHYWKKISALQLRKAKQQFLKINKDSPCSVEKSSEAFVEYINTSLG